MAKAKKKITTATTDESINYNHINSPIIVRGKTKEHSASSDINHKRPKKIKKIGIAATEKKIASTMVAAASVSDLCAPHSTHTSKQDRMITLLKRPDGATIDDLVSATGWQKHSIRGTISGALKKRFGLRVSSHFEERGRVYRILAMPVSQSTIA